MIIRICEYLFNKYPLEMDEVQNQMLCEYGDYTLCMREYQQNIEFIIRFIKMRLQHE